MNREPQPVEGRDEFSASGENAYARNLGEVKTLEVPGGRVYVCVTYRNWAKQEDGSWKVASETYGAPIFVPNDSAEGWARHKDAHQALDAELKEARAQIAVLARRVAQVERELDADSADSSYALGDEQCHGDQFPEWRHAAMDHVERQARPRLRDRLRNAARAWFEGGR